MGGGGELEVDDVDVVMVELLVVEGMMEILNMFLVFLVSVELDGGMV